ncbi:hypothetical protein ACFQ2B_39850 [Streptomyces stramineus]|uniref:TetR family transcriptional regulator n=1 Tax=Streptomyces stramineus TaxID=173861 RepID=A0ABP3JMI4_9ACTN
MHYLRSLFGSFCPDPGEVEARSLLGFSLRIGCHLIASDGGEGYDRARVMGRARELLLC